MSHSHWFRGLLLCLLVNIVSVAQETTSSDISLDSLLSIPLSTAAKYTQTSAAAPASISVITTSDFEKFHYKTLADVLNRVRGMYTSNDLNYSYVGVRGFSRPTDYNNRLLLLVDGHTFNENVYGSALLGSEFGISLDAIERIEIVRGPGSALYGTGAMFSVINVITKDYRALEGMRISGSLGSFANRTGSVQYGRELAQGSGIFLSAQYGYEDGTDFYFPEYNARSTHNGIATNVDWDSYYGLTVKYTLPNAVIRSGFTSRGKAIPTASFFTIFNDPRAQTHDDRQFIDGLFTAELTTAAELSVRLYGDRYYYTGTYPYENPLRDQSTGEWGGMELRLQWDPVLNDRLVIGTEYQKNMRADYIISYGGVETFNLNHPFSIQSFFAHNEYQCLDNLAVTTGVRYDLTTTCGNTLSPRAAVNWNAFEGGTLKFLVGRAFRTPNFYELYYVDPQLGYKDNPSLVPEIITTWEVALENRLTDRLEASVSLYRYTMEHLIDPALDPADSLYHFQNVNSITARGVEVEIGYQPTRQLQCYGIVSTQVAENELTHSKLTNSPAWLARAGASYKVSAWLDGSLEASYDGARLTVYDTMSPAAALVHAKLVVQPFSTNATISASVRNVFDARVYLPGGYEHVQSVIPQTGREIVIQATLSY